MGKKQNKNKGYQIYYHKVPKEISGYNYDKYYVGITNRDKIEDRWGEDGKYYKRQIFYNAIKKYGWDNIEHKILFTNLTFEQASEMEKDLIRILDCRLGHKGYNNSEGGEGVRGTKEKRIEGVYCVEYDCVFRNPTEASFITGDDRKDIHLICQRGREKIRHHNGTYTNTYCYMEEMNKYTQGKKYITRPIVNIVTDKVYSSIGEAKEKNKISLAKKQVLDLEKYWELEEKRKLYKVDRYMYADEYLKIFPHSKISDNISNKNIN